MDVSYLALGTRLQMDNNSLGIVDSTEEGTVNWLKQIKDLTTCLILDSLQRRIWDKDLGADGNWEGDFRRQEWRNDESEAGRRTGNNRNIIGQTGY